jgi:hypothetical protein
LWQVLHFLTPTYLNAGSAALANPAPSTKLHTAAIPTTILAIDPIIVPSSYDSFLGSRPALRRSGWNIASF